MTWRRGDPENYHASSSGYSALLPALFAAAHRALAIADILARASRDIFRFGCDFLLPMPFLVLAHRLRCAARILVRPSWVIFRLGRTVPFPGWISRVLASSTCNCWILSRKTAARRSASGEMSLIFMFIILRF